MKNYPAPQVEFLLSSPDLARCPDLQGRPEFAMVGRSNVGKSSLINRLVQRHRSKIAKTSNTPGKTRLLNFYLVDDSWVLVDLPGYGYAKVSKTEQQHWRENLEKYLLQRPSLVGVLQLIDARHGPQSNDLQMNRWLRENSLQAAVIVTKTDKTKKAQLQKNMAAVKTQLMAEKGVFGFSAETGDGANELWWSLAAWRSEFSTLRSTQE